MLLTEIADVINLGQERSKRSARRIADKMIDRSKQMAAAEDLASQELASIVKDINQTLSYDVRAPGFESYPDVLYWMEFNFDSEDPEHRRKMEMLGHHANRLISYARKAKQQYDDFAARWRAQLDQLGIRGPFEPVDSAEYQSDIFGHDIETLNNAKKFQG